ncbi:hypothetical protein AVEN_229166-1 [Araneus ventricosus]|uniref:Uncharacterized protein n=1 Tax=Araneus ventricosus TaxID=182803 RepID=A0A4Y2L4G1_ARAVE|nr:hypothetical protein AVEN_229166-1 [Araneus ventricosus]
MVLSSSSSDYGLKSLVPPAVCLALPLSGFEDCGLRGRALRPLTPSLLDLLESFLMEFLTCNLGGLWKCNLGATPSPCT